jgi:hypothetical protein
MVVEAWWSGEQRGVSSKRELCAAAWLGAPHEVVCAAAGDVAASGGDALHRILVGLKREYLEGGGWRSSEGWCIEKVRLLACARTNLSQGWRSWRASV